MSPFNSISSFRVLNLFSSNCCSLLIQTRLSSFFGLLYSLNQHILCRCLIYVRWYYFRKPVRNEMNIWSENIHYLSIITEEILWKILFKIYNKENKGKVITNCIKQSERRDHIDRLCCRLSNSKSPFPIDINFSSCLIYNIYNHWIYYFSLNIIS